MRALMVGGTGPTGPHVIAGLVERGFQVSMLHRGGRELPDLPDVEHLHVDPYVPTQFAGAIGGRSFDLVISTYGRIGAQAEILAGRCERFLGVGGIPAYAGFADPDGVHPGGMKLLAREHDPLAIDLGGGPGSPSRLAWRVVQTERQVFALHERGAFCATWFRYPFVYGPRNPIPWEWSVIKRVQDGRRGIILPEGGHAVLSRAAARNAAHGVLLAVDQASAAAGQTFNVADDDQYSLRQWVASLNGILGSDLDVIGLPGELAHPGHFLLPLRGSGTFHALVDTSKIRGALGYRDAVSAVSALEEAVRWYADNPVTAEDYPQLLDAFDYNLEDQLVGEYGRLVEELGRRVRVPDPAPFRHSYAHPARHERAGAGP